MVLLAYGIILTVSWIVVTFYMIINSRRIAFLKDISSEVTGYEPAVDIIVAVKDEEDDVENALTSLCNLNYPHRRIIVINDRSTDGTAAILKRMAAARPELHIITINELPAGWLGKNNALYQGYLASSGEWLLFTDADIVYQPATLTKAINYCYQNKLDHLTALPEITSRSQLFKSVVNTFAIMLELQLRPWEASNPKSKASIGIGAFNFVKRTVYEQAGTHIPISLRPDDDLKLAQIIKKAGFKQDVVYANNELSLEWYTSLSAFVNGLMKNSFSISNYHLPTALLMALLTLVVFVLPVPVLVLSGWPGIFLALLLMLFQVLLVTIKKGLRGKWWHALLIPFAGAVMIYIILKSAFKTLRQGGIYWRNSFYPLADLKKQR